MSNDLPYRPEHINNADANELGLTLEEVGAFVKLKRALWRGGGFLPDDEWILARACGAGRRQWARIARALRDKLTIANGQVSVEEISVMLRLAQERHAKAVRAGRQSAVARGFPAISRFDDAKALKNNEAASNVVGSKFELSPKNQNQNKNLESKNLSASGSAAMSPADKFYEQSTGFLIKRVGVRGLAARSQIAKWLVALDGNESDLQTIMNAAGAENLQGARLIAVIDQRVGNRRTERKQGPPLPFPPNLVINSGK
jgi:uncharacterized protein YdaU (DUF1376 family)